MVELPGSRSVDEDEGASPLGAEDLSGLYDLVILRRHQVAVENLFIAVNPFLDNDGPMCGCEPGECLMPTDVSTNTWRIGPPRWPR